MTAEGRRIKRMMMGIFGRFVWFILWLGMVVSDGSLARAILRILVGVVFLWNGSRRRMVTY